MKLERILWTEWLSNMAKPLEKLKLLPQSTEYRLYVKKWPVCAVVYPHVSKLYDLRSTIPGLAKGTKLLFANLQLDAAWKVYNIRLYPKSIITG